MDKGFDELYPCQCCGKQIDDCICPECPECGEVGNPDCYEQHGMKYSQEQVDSYEAAILEQAEADKSAQEAADSYCEQLQWEKDHEQEIKDFLKSVAGK